MPSANLDIVRLVLLQAFEPLETYNLYGPPGPRELTNHRKTYSFLCTCCLVSKDWYEVAIPLLYSTLVLSSYEKGAPSFLLTGLVALQSTFRHHPLLLRHVQTISCAWDELPTSSFLEAPHTYPKVVRLGALAIEWHTQGGLFPKIIGLRERFPRLEELRISVAILQDRAVEPEAPMNRIDTRSPSVRLPKSLRKLFLSGVDGFVDVDAFVGDNRLPLLEEIHLEFFRGSGSFFFTTPAALPFFQKFGRNLLAISVSSRRLAEIPTDPVSLLYNPFAYDFADDFPSCPAYLLSSSPSLRKLTTQGLDLVDLLRHGHRKLETLELGLVNQPPHIAGLDVDVGKQIRLETVLPQLARGFSRTLFPRLETVRIASLDFRLPSDRSSPLLQKHAPSLLEQGLHLYDRRGLEWVDTMNTTTSSWPSSLLDLPISVVDAPSPTQQDLHRQSTLYRTAIRHLYRGGEEETEESEFDEEDEEEEETEEAGGWGSPEFKKAMEDLRWVLFTSGLAYGRSREIMEEKYLSRYAEEYAEEDSAKRRERGGALNDEDLKIR